MTPPDRRPQPADLEPFEVDPVPVVAGGTLVWALAAVVLLVLRDRLAEAGYGLWPWTALAGTGLGLCGTAFLLRRRARLRAGLERPHDDGA
ncbi:DUF2530 domain-containing protein [Vallicoccus soli]|uniref:DUF2530 domain-containing protein n=1 Tax=Vallicoccus soli TaxID=2339232 RepID=A0A3A3Z4D9_9ACTN|nr:DUF2530 domain-containing protein [Vallicoccus soli]RJK97798.1 DUF2530 domain-containing protein [Vallicoccus soli]